MASSTRHPGQYLTFDDFKLACLAYTRTASCQSALRKEKSRREDTEADEEEEYLGPEIYARGWRWREHPMLPRLSHLTRTFEMVVPSHMNLVDGKVYDDPLLTHLAQVRGNEATPFDATLHISNDPLGNDSRSSSSSSSSTSSITCIQEIFLSPTWNVPVLYILAHNTSSGHPLSLDDIMNTHFGIFLAGDSCQPGGRSGTLDPFPIRREEPVEPRKEGQRASSLTEPPQTAYFPPVSLTDHPITSLPCVSLHPCQTATVIAEMLHSHEDEHKQQSTMHGQRYLEAFMTICASAVEMRA